MAKNKEIIVYIFLKKPYNVNTNVIRFFYYMDILQFVELIKNAKSIAPLLSANVIRVNDVVYDLADAIHESSYSEFNIENISDIKQYNYSVSGISDKKSKKPMTNRISIQFNDGSKGLTIEYNDSAQFTKNDKLTDSYYNLVAFVSANHSYQDKKIILLNSCITTIGGETLTLDDYYAKYKIAGITTKSVTA